MLTNLNAAILYVDNIKKSKDFYTKILGFQIVEDQGEYVTLKISDIDNTFIALNAQHRSFQKIGKQTISIKSTNIENDYEDLKTKGVVIFDKLESKPWGKYFAFLDLDGNHIDVSE